MDSDKKPNIYETGADFFRDTAADYGTDKALDICGNYLAAQIKTDSAQERQFCRELFVAMREGEAPLADSAQLVYPFPFENAVERLEASFYNKSRGRNADCAQAIDSAINASCYETYHYNLELAAMSVIQEHGFSRVNAVLAHNLQRHDYDGRYSRDNKEWASGFALPDGAFDYSYMNAHPILLEDFTKYARKLYDTVDAERFALPGRPEALEKVQGYEIERSIAFDDHRGFAIGHNPEAASPFVCWQFTTDENGKRDFYWGAYGNDRDDAVKSYITRIITHMDDGTMREIRAAAEKRERPSVLGKLKKTHEQQPPSVKAKASKAKEPER